MSSGSITQSRFISIIISGTAKKVAMEQPPWSYGFMPLPFAALKLQCLFCLMYLESYFGNVVDAETIKIDDQF
jgi:hypothetical protein